MSQTIISTNWSHTETRDIHSKAIAALNELKRREKPKKMVKCGQNLYIGVDPELSDQEAEKYVKNYMKEAERWRK
jgi:hypothetical protein